MKRKITLSLALVLSIALLSLMSSDSTANAQQRGRRPSLDTGLIKLGLNQKLVLSVAVGDVNRDGNEEIIVQFRQLGYQMAATAGDVITVNTMRFQDTDPITLAPGEAASIDIDIDDPSIWGVRGIVLSSSQNVHVNASIVNKETGNIIAVLVTLVPAVSK